MLCTNYKLHSYEHKLSKYIKTKKKENHDSLFLIQNWKSHLHRQSTNGHSYCYFTQNVDIFLLFYNDIHVCLPMPHTLLFSGYHLLPPVKFVCSQIPVHTFFGTSVWKNTVAMVHCALCNTQLLSQQSHTFQRWK